MTRFSEEWYARRTAADAAASRAELESESHPQESAKRKPAAVPSLAGDTPAGPAFGAMIDTDPQTSFTLELPWPPTLNHFYRATEGYAKVLTEEYKAFRRKVEHEVVSRQIRQLTGRLRVQVVAYPPDRRQRDLDNIVKPIFDSLQAAGAIRNDSDIDNFSVMRITGSDRTGVTVTVEVCHARDC